MRASVGIGVAVMTNTSGVTPFSIMWSRCITPKRCCSSIMTSPSLPELHVLFEQRVGPDDYVNQALGHQPLDLLFLPLRGRAHQ